MNTLVKVNWKDNKKHFHSYVAVSNINFNQNDNTLTFISKESGILTYSHT